ncbi:transcriptional regulator [Nocardioides lianchengensis]|uniref:Winged helix DNA-binding domain-containing protein n=1 Tax=Nocardioides lianchengensis TaxID=1045774 RepID=A0A1G6ZFW6_9ACTN|nr:transcriptional regulator [Nocardioides lianchengensis]NYG11407.1 DNA-binding MarR family transcriptional regulator [Nocardioides lianchengensis]SDE01137.1 Winged helix DNA-binding domain-containing protein [Nocardioides lianchengensis]
MIEDLDPVIHAPKRLAAMAVLSTATTVTFPFLREHLGVSDSDLSKQMATLERAEYVEVRKAGRGRGATTTYRITRTGRAAYDRHRRALAAILDG